MSKPTCKTCELGGILSCHYHSRLAGQTVPVEIAEEIGNASFERREMSGQDAFAVAANCTHVFHRPTSAGGACFTPQTVSWTIGLLNQRRNYRYLVTYDNVVRKVWLTFTPG